MTDNDDSEAKSNSEMENIEFVSNTLPYTKRSPLIYKYKGDSFNIPHIFNKPLLADDDDALRLNCHSCGLIISPHVNYYECTRCNVTIHTNCPMSIAICSTYIDNSSMTRISQMVSDLVPKIPSIIIHCIMELEARLGDQKILVLPSNQVDSLAWYTRNKIGSEQLLLKFKNNLIPYLPSFPSEFIFGCMFMYLDELDEPLLTRDLWDYFSDNKSTDDEADLAIHLSQLPMANLDTIAFLVLFIKNILGEIEAGFQPKLLSNHVLTQFAKCIVGKPIVKSERFYDKPAQGARNIPLARMNSLDITPIEEQIEILEKIVALETCVNNMTWESYLNRPLGENEYYVYK